MKAWKEAGIKVIPVVASVAMAKLMTRLGASALIAEGGESGGHVGELTTMVLVPQVCDATNLPVLAAGGIADGRGMAAALMLGACGVQMGTRFLSAYECTVHPSYKERILKATDLCTMVTGKRLGHPVRSLRTPFARAYAKAEYGGMPDEELEALGAGKLRMAVQEGDAENGCFLSGQCAAHIIQLLLFSLIQIISAFDQLSDMLLYKRPAQAHFLLEAPSCQAKPLTVVIHKAGGAIQVGVAVPANAVFLFQEFLRSLGRRLTVIQGGNPKPATCKAGTAPKDMINLFVRNRKCRGLCLCMGLYGGNILSLGLPVNRFNLFLLGWDLEANLNRIRLRVGQA